MLRGRGEHTRCLPRIAIVGVRVDSCNVGEVAGPGLVMAPWCGLSHDVVWCGYGVVCCRSGGWRCEWAVIRDGVWDNVTNDDVAFHLAGNASAWKALRLAQPAVGPATHPVRQRFTNKLWCSSSPSTKVAAAAGINDADGRVGGLCKRTAQELLEYSAARSTRRRTQDNMALVFVVFRRAQASHPSLTDAGVGPVASTNPVEMVVRGSSGTARTPDGVHVVPPVPAPTEKRHRG